MHKTVVLNIVGLAPAFIGPSMPRLATWAATGRGSRIMPAFPAVTCTAQSDYLTGQYPSTHGVVGNGWYSHDDCEIRFWKQANPLVQAPKIWDTARAIDPSFTCANLFWWFNMYSTVDYAVTPRPMYPADGRKLPDVHSHPASLRDDLQRELGQFPLFEFWGPRASIRCSEWIAAAARRVEQKHNPTLTLVYLPHLDYNLQRHGISSPLIQPDLVDIDRVAGDLIAFYEDRGAQVIVLSEYGLCDVTLPVHPNRALREHGLLAIREERGLELLDAGASAAFAVADHQIAHIYVNDRSRLDEARALISQLPGVEQVLDRREQSALHVDHTRAGDLVAISRSDAWFTYYYWLDDRRAPDFARTVDIHRKPGYDPVELILDPAIRFPSLYVGWRLFKRSIGMRALLDVTPLDATLVKGSHGRPGDGGAHGPVCISRRGELFGGDTMASVDVYHLILKHLTS
ncbi:MAG: alkaline phosphatase family protein [Acidobacteria bacterium]|nr:alkaline phosphatase family protein [Acidobacteriota bacterium]